MNSKKGAFIVLEGPDKSGKSTQASRLVSFLKNEGRKVVHTREPGGTSFAEAIREILLDPAHRVHPIAELLLYEAARAQHTHEVIVPALRSGAVVVCERYTLATLAYQGYGRGIPETMIRSLNRLATNGLRPDATIVLDIPDSEFGRRDRNRRHDRMENEDSAFRKKVRSGYRALAAREPKTALVDSSLPLEQVEERVRKIVCAALKSGREKTGTRS